MSLIGLSYFIGRCFAFVVVVRVDRWKCCYFLYNIQRSLIHNEIAANCGVSPIFFSLYEYGVFLYLFRFIQISDWLNNFLFSGGKITLLVLLILAMQFFSLLLLLYTRLLSIFNVFFNFKFFFLFVAITTGIGIQLHEYVYKICEWIMLALYDFVYL